MNDLKKELKRMIGQKGLKAVENAILEYSIEYKNSLYTKEDGENAMKYHLDRSKNGVKSPVLDLDRNGNAIGYTVKSDCILPDGKSDRFTVKIKGESFKSQQGMILIKEGKLYRLEENGKESIVRHLCLYNHCLNPLHYAFGSNSQNQSDEGIWIKSGYKEKPDRTKKDQNK